jgi:hypothetical protein
MRKILFSFLSVYTQSAPVNTVSLNRAGDVLDKERVISPLQLEEGRNPLPFEETASGDSSCATLPGSFFGTDHRN